MVAASHTLGSAELGQLQRSLDHAAFPVLTSVVLYMIRLVKDRMQGYMHVRRERGTKTVDCGFLI